MTYLRLLRTMCILHALGLLCFANQIYKRGLPHPDWYRQRYSFDRAFGEAIEISTEELFFPILAVSLIFTWRRPILRGLRYLYNKTNQGAL